MHIVLLGASLFLSLALQATVFPEFTFQRVKPDLLLIIVIFYALFYGSIKGAQVGFFYGLVEDLVIGRFIGLNAVTKMLTGYLIGLGEKKLYKDNFFVPLISAFSGTILNQLLYLIFINLVSEKAFFMQFRQTVIPLALYNMFLGIFIYRFFIKSLSRNGQRISRYR